MPYPQYLEPLFISNLFLFHIEFEIMKFVLIKTNKETESNHGHPNYRIFTHILSLLIVNG